MSQKDVRLSPDLIDQLNALASRLTAQGEYDAVDLIDTVVARVTAMPPRELLAEALEALTEIAKGEEEDFDGALLCNVLVPMSAERCAEIARAAADKIRAAMTQDKQ